MQVRELMTEHVDYADPKLTVAEAAQRMRDEDIGALPVGAGDKLDGMLTDRDIVVRAIAEGKDPNQTQIGQLLTEKVLYCFEDQTIEEAAHSMGENQVRRMVVLNRDKRLVGIISLGDIAAKTDPRLLQETLKDISQAA